MNIQLVGIHKIFGKVHANNDIQLNIESGTIHGILGENGAGKSTLMKIISGYFSADKGQIILDGKEVKIHSPAEAIKQGIGMLHQDPSDFPPMKVLDNFMVGSPGTSFIDQIFPDHKATLSEFSNLCNQFEFNLDPDSYVDSLTVGERQQLEIIRLIWLGARVLIFDEPTTGISTPQKIKLFATLRILAKSGKTILFVSHKLEDVEQLCQNISILRRGKLVGKCNPPYDTEQLVNLMFGKSISLGDRQETNQGKPIIRIQNLSVEDYRLRLSDINLEVNSGEVIGLAGMEGSGQLTFLRSCAGLVRPVAGEIWLNQSNLTGKNYPEFMKHGASYIPASRMEEGLLPGLTLAEHFTLAYPSRGFFINQKQSKAVATEMIDDFNIRGTPTTPIESLSGGNQQRTLLALMRPDLSLILMEHPTRGLDVESSIYIWCKLKERCRNGTSIIFISTDLDELLFYSDRILVFFSGAISHPIQSTETTIDELGFLIGGKGWKA